MVDDHQPVAQVRRLLHVVGGQQHRYALGLQAGQLVPYQQPCLRIQTGSGLVEHQHLGLVQECAGDQQAPPHSARQFVGLAVGLVAQLEQVQCLQRTPSGDVSWKVKVAREGEQVLNYAEIRIEAVGLRDDAELGLYGAGRGAHVEAGDRQGS